MPDNTTRALPNAKQNFKLLPLLAKAALIFVLAQLINIYVLGIFHIENSAMQNTLYQGDYVLLERLAYSGLMPGSIASQPKRGDLAAFNLGEIRGGAIEGALSVRRIIGLPGDRISIRSKSVYLNGAKLDEPYVRHSAPQEMLPLRDELEEMTVPENSYFILGDNRDSARDSRLLGPVSSTQLRGKVLRVIFSYSESTGAWRNERVWLPIH